MKTKLAGSLQLQDAIAQTLADVREKMKTAAEKCDEGEKKENPFHKLHEKKESKAVEAKEEAAEKKASVIDVSDPDEVEKLAAALDESADLLVKEADQIDNGNESKQGGEQLPVKSKTTGTQVQSNKGSAKTPKGMSTSPSDAPAQGVNATDEHRAPGGTGAKYPAKGVLKTGSALDSVIEKEAWSVTGEGHELDAEHHRAEADAGHRQAKAHKEYAKKQPGIAGVATGAQLLQGIPSKASHVYALNARLKNRHNDYAAKKHEKGRNAYNPFGGWLTKSRQEEKEGKSEAKKKAASAQPSAVDYILSKIAAGADLGGESRQGGETLASYDKPKMVPGRALIQNAQNLKNVTKPEAKAPRKAELAQVLTEHGHVHDGTNEQIKKNLRSSAKGGVKTAAARALLQKIAEEGCTCKDGSCRHCTMTKAAAKMHSGREAKSTTVTE